MAGTAVGYAGGGILAILPASGNYRAIWYTKESASDSS